MTIRCLHFMLPCFHFIVSWLRVFISLFRDFECRPTAHPDGKELFYIFYNNRSWVYPGSPNASQWQLAIPYQPLTSDVNHFTWSHLVSIKSRVLMYSPVPTRFLIRNWSIRNWGYRGQNFKKLEGYITPTLRNWSVANSRNWILGVHKIHNFRINPSPKVKKWFLFW